MTFQQGSHYPPGVLIRAGISGASFRAAVRNGVLTLAKSPSQPGISVYTGRQILHALEQGTLTIDPSRAAVLSRPTGSVARKPAPIQRAVATPTPTTATPTKAGSQPGLQARYRAARNLWARAVDGELTLCDGDRAAASIKAHRNNPGLTGLVDE